jgi:hypothetical protein
VDRSRPGSKEDRSFVCPLPHYSVTPQPHTCAVTIQLWTEDNAWTPRVEDTPHSSWLWEALNKHQPFCCFVCCWFLALLGFELRDHTSIQPTRFFCDWLCQDRVSRTIFLGWLRTMILLISVS